MSGAGALLLVVAVGLLVWPPGGSAVRARALRAARRPPPPAHDHSNAPGRRRWLLAGAAGTAVGLLLGGLPGAVMGVSIAVGGARLLRNRASGDGSGRDAVLRDLPGACDLLAVCLSAGVPVPGALAAVAEATPGPLGVRLGAVAALYRLGAEPRNAWAGAPPELARLGRVLVRAAESGASVVTTLHSLAGDLRTAARATAEAGVRRAGVWILAPLGLCFLPAFVCLGVAPLVLGIAADVFG